MIIITGAAGFIGSCLAKFLVQRIDEEITLVDDFSRTDKYPNLRGLESMRRVERNVFFDWAENKDITCVFHIGARTDTTEFDYAIFEDLNVTYSRKMWDLCVRKNAALIYASSAATYGNGEHGYKDDHEIVSRLEPLNPYGRSKNEFDKWALAQPKAPGHWYGLKFFNVYGPNEYHKGRMASVVMHAYRQIVESGEMRLFRSHNPAYGDGEQLRDFVYVKDVCEVIWFLYTHKPKSGLYNLGTGEARTFLDLAKSVFRSMGEEPVIRFVDTPLDIRDRYQYFTEADMSKLRAAGYDRPFTTLEDGIRDYVKNYLQKDGVY